MVTGKDCFGFAPPRQLSHSLGRKNLQKIVKIGKDNLPSMQKNIRVCILIFLAIILCGCAVNDSSQQDAFYSDGGDPWGGQMKFPLIKPYFAIHNEILQSDSSNVEKRWDIWLQKPPSERDFYYYTTIYDVQKIAVKDGVILVYSSYEREVQEEYGQEILYWFVIIPDESIEMGFNQIKDFLEYIQQWDIQEPIWQNPDDIMLEFNQTQCLDWIPGCD